MNIFEELFQVAREAADCPDTPAVLRNHAKYAAKVASKFTSSPGVGHRDFHTGAMQVEITDRPLGPHEARVTVLHMGEK